MGENGKNEWTVRILRGDLEMYAGLRWNNELEEHATLRLDHARAFPDRERAERWITGLGVKVAEPARFATLRAETAKDKERAWARLRTEHGVEPPGAVAGPKSRVGARR